MPRIKLTVLLATVVTLVSQSANAQFETQRPALHGKNWVAITGKPLGATAGALTFAKGGNAVDAACAMLAATATMWDTLGWGGETQALIYNPNTGEVKGINALGVAPSGATVEYFKSRGYDYPPEYGPLAAVTPGTPGGLMVMLAEYGTLSLAEVLAPAISMADGYPMEAAQADNIESNRDVIAQWEHSRRVLLPNLDSSNRQQRAAPFAGEIFSQPELKATLQKLVDTEAAALERGKTREEAIMAAYDRFYRGDIAREIVRATREAGGLMTMQDLADWEVYIEEPVTTRYRGVDVYKLTHWVQGPVMLQTLNILENLDLKSMGYNSARYIHALYQAMNLAFADRDFYYGDPYFPPAEPIEGLLSKDYAKARLELIDWDRNDPRIRPGNPYEFQAGDHPFPSLLKLWRPDVLRSARSESAEDRFAQMSTDEAFVAGTTSIQAADAEGWVVSITPSGGWIPPFIAGRTGVGLSQRMQSFVLEHRQNPYNVLQPGQRPRATLTPGMALKDGKPYLSFAVQGGDTQDQNLLQFLLNMVEFDMTVQEAVEAANINSYQMHSSFGAHTTEPGRLVVRADVPPWVQKELTGMGYRVETENRTSGPITAIFFDRENATLWGGASNFGEDYGIAW